MLDAVKLARGHVSIVGVFTDYIQTSGRAFGENAPKVLSLLNTRKSTSETLGHFEPVSLNVPVWAHTNAHQY